MVIGGIVSAVYNKCGVPPPGQECIRPLFGNKVSTIHLGKSHERGGGWRAVEGLQRYREACRGADENPDQVDHIGQEEPLPQIGASSREHASGGSEGSKDEVEANTPSELDQRWGAAPRSRG